jgi:hypothetical protein
MKTHPLLLAAVFLSTTLVVRAGSVVNQYFPMNNGDSRYYQDHYSPTDKSTEIFTQATYNGNSVFSLNFHDEWNVTSLGTGTWHLGNNGSPLALYGINSGGFGNIPFNSPANLLTDQILTSGGTVTSQVTGLYYLPGTGNITVNLTVQTTVTSVGTITVPAGTFTNCKQVFILVTASYMGISLVGSGFYDSAAWVLAPGVGIIDDGVATWDVNTGQFSYYDLFGNEEDYFELVSDTIHGGIDSTPPSDSLASWPVNGTQLYINPVFIWGTASDAGLGGSGIAQVTVNGIPASNDTATGNGSAVWSTYASLPLGTDTITIVAKDGAGNSTTNLLTVVEFIQDPNLPKLNSTLQAHNIILSWPTNVIGFTLQSSPNIGASAVWSTVSPLPVVVNGANVVTNAMSGSRMFFRLTHP